MTDEITGRIEASEARQRGFLEAALDCVIMIDAAGCVVEFNPAAERTFGYRRADVIGRTLAELIVPPQLRDRHELALQRFVETRDPTVMGVRIELDGMRADGSEFPVELTLSQVDGEPLLIFGALRDLTAAKQAAADLARFADEQAALRRVATLVARGHQPGQVFDSVCAETGRLFDAADVTLVQFEGRSSQNVRARWRSDGDADPRVSPSGDVGSVAARIRQTGTPQRLDVLGLPARSAIGAPIVLDGQGWGALIAGSDAPEGFPLDTETRVAMFADIVAISVGNAVTKDELLLSRRRLVHAADDARRKLGRDLHDGAQQQLVFALMNLQMGFERFDSDPDASREGLQAALAANRRGLEDLRDLAAGLHPSILTNHGLAAAVDALAERGVIPVRTDVVAGRYPPHLESDVYFLVAEGLTNIAKHADASFAEVAVEEHNGRLVVEVRDDGDGGADWAGGTGLRGLKDRIEAVGGEIRIDSPSGEGTRLLASLPIAEEPPGM